VPFIRKFLLLLSLLMSSIYGDSLSFKEKVSPWQSFSISQDLSAFQLIVESDSSESKDLFFSDLIDPVGRVIIQGNVGSPMSYRVPSKLYSTMKNRVRPTYIRDGLFSVVIDKSEKRDSVVEKGVWKFRLGKKAVSTVARSFWHLSKVRLESVVPAQLKVNVYKSKTFQKTSQKELLESLKKVQKLYDSYGIGLNFVIKEKWSEPAVETSDLEEKLKKISVSHKDNPSLYLINRLNSTVEKDFQGLAGCLPGFRAKFIKAHCALLVSITDQALGSFEIDKLTKVISHEIAHMLGLFHLEDDFYPFGKLFDPFQDTSRENDFINVMHKTSDFFGILEFSQSQVRKMLSHPMLYQ